MVPTKLAGQKKRAKKEEKKQSVRLQWETVNKDAARNFECVCGTVVCACASKVNLWPRVVWGE
jgi:hypothetical protein